MTDFLCTDALLADGWATNALLRVDSSGVICAIEVGVKETAASLTGDKPVRRLSGTVLPGMINLHSHAHQRAMAGLAEVPGRSQDSFWSWRDIMYRAVARITPDHLYAIALQLYTEMLAAGYTHVCEFQYLHHDLNGHPYDDIAQMSLCCVEAARKSGIGLTILPVFYRFGGFDKMPAQPQQRRFVNTLDSFISIVERLDAATTRDSRINVGIAPHSLRACDDESLRQLASFAAQTISDGDAARPIHIHIAEQQLEVDDCLAHYGARPLQWLYDNVDVNQRWCLVHATHSDDSELRTIARSDAVAGLCPTTEASLGDGIFDATRFNQLGGHFGIGSDSQISVSPVEELRWLEYGQRLTRQQRNLLVDGERSNSTGRHLYDSAVRGGQQAAAVKAGPIEVGNRADLIVLDDEHPLLYGRSADATLDSYLFSGNRSLVRDVVVGGEIVVDTGVGRCGDVPASGYRAAIDALNLSAAS